MKVFLDTNIILDFYDSDRGHYLPTAIIFDLAIKGNIELSVCSQSFITAFYILRKYYDKDDLYNNMRSLFQLCQVSSVDKHIIEKALSQNRNDFEDAIQYFSSESIKADIILSRDTKGFKEFDAQVLTAEDFLNKYLDKLI